MMKTNALAPLQVRPRFVTMLALSAALFGCGTGGADGGSGGTTSAGGGTSLGGVNGTGGSETGSSGAPSGGSVSGGTTSQGGTANGGASSGAAQNGNGGRANANGGNSSAGGGAGGKTSSGGAGGKASGGASSGGKANASGGSANASGGSGGSDIVVPPGYKLVWHDEFDVDGAPNAANWKYENGFVRNEEDQWYQPDNASVEGGMLVIEGRKERVQNPNYSSGSSDWKTSRQYAEYTSSSLHTSGLQSWQYGRFEMRGRIPTSAGMWPAWWTLGVSGEWPSNGEIDIMEFYNGKLLANVACGTSTRWQAKWDSATKQLSALGSGWSSQFHVWRMDWDDQNIVLSVDDQQMNTTALSSMLNPNGDSPFKQKAYMIVNLAIGGNNGGDPSKTTFPQRYEIDYVRVFQKM